MDSALETSGPEREERSSRGSADPVTPPAPGRPSASAASSFPAGPAAPALVLALLPGIAWMSDAVDWRAQWVSESLRTVAGYEPAEWVRVREFWDVRVHPEDRPRVLRIVEEAIERGVSDDYDYRWRIADGSYHWFRDRLRVVPGPEGEPAMVGFMIDVTAEYEERAARLDAELRRDQLEAAIEQSSDIVTITGADGVLTYVNPAIERVLGVDPAAAVGRGALDLVNGVILDPGDHAAILRDALATALAGERWEDEYEVRTQAGSVVRLESTLTPVSDDAGHVTMTLGIHRDVTHLRRLEARLAEAARLEAIGQLAGGIAHDFNNILTAILGYTTLIAEQQGPDSAILEDLRQVQAAGERAQQLTAQLLAFGRRSMLRPAPVDVADLVRGLAPMLQRLVGDDLELRPGLPGRPVVAFVDKGQLEQAVMNLVVNARNAMPGGGRIDLAVATRAGDGERVPEGEWAVVTVADTGVGMPPEVVARIFEPFFTTDEFGRGTGLGLAVVDGFVKMSGGRVLVTTEPGRGSTFELWLPVALGRPLSPRRNGRAPADPAVVRPATTPLTILVAEDEAVVRALARRGLLMAGHRVLLAASGQEAIDVARRFDGRIDVLLADVVMPGIRGPRLAEAIRASRPGIRVVLTSGYSDGADDRRSLPLGDAAFLAKPYTMDDLLAAVEGRARSSEPSAG